jgi:pyruvate kinase
MTDAIKISQPKFSNTKIVATLGPASSSDEMICELITAGVNVFRLNMAHAATTEQDERVSAIRSVSRRLGTPVAILVDLAGPKMRLGELPGGQLILRTGQRVRIVKASQAASDDNVSPLTLPELTTTYEPLLDEVAVGNRIMIADGTVAILVEEVSPSGALCRVVRSGLIRSRQGINLPGVKLSVAAMSDVDRENAVWAARNDIDFVGLSFVRQVEDVRELQALLAEYAPGGPSTRPQVIAKIEKPEALDNLEEIVALADGVMVARGDLGVEIDIAQVAVAQKRIIKVCNHRLKPVIIATQMLDSMQNSQLPTRAEVSDVANAILDGADACMLSGETAIGSFPREAVEMMKRIALATEPLCRDPHHDPLRHIGENADTARWSSWFPLNPITEATVAAAGQMAETLHARLILASSTSGAAALYLAKNRFCLPVLCVSPFEASLRKMCLYWSIIPLLNAPLNEMSATLKFAVDWGRKNGLLDRGDRIVVITGSHPPRLAHNVTMVHEVD